MIRDIAIAYRIYPKVSKIPLYYAENKFKLADLALKSFKNSIGNLKIKLYALLDNCPQQYYNLFQDIFPKDDLELISLNNVGNQKSYELQIDILSNQKYAKTVYLAEDDYLYVPGSLESAFDFFNSSTDIDFVSLYDHSQYYTSFLHISPTFLRFHSGSHWRTSGATCLTFMTSKKDLVRTAWTLKSFCRGNHDCSMWFNLTKKFVLNPMNLFKVIYAKDFESASIFLKAWRYGIKALISQHKYNLWTPIPSLATHLDKPFIAPKVNWDLIKKTTENISCRTK